MKKLTLLILITTLLFSCGKKIACTTPAEPVRFRLLDKQGNDLFNPLIPGAYKPNDIRIYYTENGAEKQTEVSVQQIPNTDTYFVKTEIAWLANNGRTFKVKLSETVIDELYLRNDQVSENKCSFFRFVELKYNGVAYGKTEKGFFEFVK